MEPKKLFLVGTHRYSYNAGEPAEIIGVEMVTPDGNQPRPCFRVRYSDGKEDHTPIFNEPGGKVKNPYYELITEDDVSAGRIPKITH